MPDNLHNFEKPSMHRTEEFIDEIAFKKVKTEFMEHIMTLLIASMGLITVFAWDETLKSFFEKVFGPLQSLKDKFLYSILITFIAVTTSFILGKIYLKKRKKGLRK